MIVAALPFFRVTVSRTGTRKAAFTFKAISTRYFHVLGLIFFYLLFYVVQIPHLPSE